MKFVMARASAGISAVRQSTIVFSKAIELCVGIALILSATYGIRGQEGQSPDRGFRPAGSYALSDIETISMSNGNLILHIPLASLPPGRGELSAGIGLIYNSKLWDTWIYQLDGFSASGDPRTWPLNMLTASLHGGWRYAFGYKLETMSRLDQYTWQHTPTCPSEEASYIVKFKVVFPDGSEHFFRPMGYSESPVLNDGYFRIGPDGWGHSCGGRPPGSPAIYTPFTGAAMTYYSIDGSYLRLDIEHDGDQNYLNNPWTLTFPDGRRVTGGNAPQRIYDRNNNYVEIQNTTYNSHPATRLVDQQNRSITLEYDTSANVDRVYFQGVGGEQLVSTITWKNTCVDKLYVSSEDSSAPVEPQYASETFRVVDQINLPVQTGGLAWTFNYNGNPTHSGYSVGWGELSSIALPSGAQANYQFTEDGQNARMYDQILDNAPSRKDLTYAREYDGSSTPTTDTWTYAFGPYGSGGSVTGPEGGSSSEVFNSLGGATPFMKEQWNYGVSLATFKPDGTKIERLWAPNRPAGLPRDINAFLKTEFTSIKDAAGNYVKTAIRDYNNDKNGNVTRVAEYDWVDYASVPRDGVGRPTAIPTAAIIKRTTTSSYYNATPDASDFNTFSSAVYNQTSAPSLRSAVFSTEAADGTGQVAARSEFFYDSAANTGNLIQKTVWDSTKGPYSNPLTPGNSISTSNQYTNWSSGNTGKLFQTTDARGISTVFTYGSVGGYDLYPTQTQVAYGTSVQRTETREYDFSTGLVTRVTDVDNNVSSATTYDVFGRPTLMKAAEGKPEETRTRTEYSDTLRRVIVRSDLNTLGDEKLVTIQHYDQLGRIRLTRQLEDSSTQSAYNETHGIKVQTRYSFSGANSFVLTSNPYLADYSYNAGGESTMGWARTKNDNGGRLIEVQTFGGTALPAPWGGNTSSSGRVLTAYDANTVTVTDQADKQRKSVTDVLGRLVQVYEAPNDPNYNYLTSYTYDALDNLRTVNQDTQTRMFVYDSLKRLVQAANPESGNVCYGHVFGGQCQNDGYDENGNLRFKTDAREVLTTYTYDALNRNTSVTYSDGTPTVNRYYDGSINGRGRLTWTETVGVSATVVDIYDALGRINQYRQRFWVNNTWGDHFFVTANYDRAGQVLSQGYPSGRNVTYNYDNAGRLSNFTGNLGDGTARSYATGIAYASNGAWIRETFGTNTPLYNKRHYNNRQQLYDMRVSTVNDDGNWNRGAIVNYYSLANYGLGTTGTDTNGNLYVQQYWIPTDDAISGYSFMQQNYGYDALNRLNWVGEYQNGATNTGGQTFAYDRYGNRTISGASGYGINTAQSWIDPVSNRLYAPSDQNISDPEQRLIRYDAAGNQKADYYSAGWQGSRTYDGENRMKSATDTANNTSTYVYDGDGRRIQRILSDGTEIRQVYGPGGELLAEYAANAAPSNPQKEYGYRNGELLVTAEPNANIHWLVTDQLGTPRMVFDQTGSLANVSRHDYLPFGEELGAGTGGRTTAQGYSASDGVRQKFTDKERDTETGLDYFGARYYSSTQGRFTSVDPSRKSIHPMNPQSWNRYSYTYNNPLALLDDNGKWPTSTHNKIIDRAFDALSKSKREQIKSGSASVDANWNKPARLLTENTLMESQAYKHAMTPGSKVTELGSVGAAQQWANAEMYKFIDAKLGEAQRQFQAGENRNGVNNAALVTFGEAVHPIMDNMSPAHRWMQVYDLQPYLNTAGNAPIPELAPLYAEKALYDFIKDMNAHSAQEARDPTQDEMNAMVDQMRMRYQQTFGQEAYEQAVSREERDATERRLKQQRQ